MITSSSRYWLCREGFCRFLYLACFPSMFNICSTKLVTNLLALFWFIRPTHFLEVHVFSVDLTLNCFIESREDDIQLTRGLESTKHVGKLPLKLLFGRFHNIHYIERSFHGVLWHALVYRVFFKITSFTRCSWTVQRSSCTAIWSQPFPITAELSCTTPKKSMSKFPFLIWWTSTEHLSNTAFPLIFLFLVFLAGL